MEGFFLGLASGITCLAYCASVLTPYMLGEGNRAGKNAWVLGQFLAGRLMGYLLFGAFAWGAGRLVLQNEFWQARVKGLSFLFLGGLMLVFVLLKKPPKTCVVPSAGVYGALSRWPAAIPLALGFFTGLNLCPPFLIALANSATSSSLPRTLLFFLEFFVGTSIYMLPLPLVGVFHSKESLKTIGRMAAGLMSLYYLYLGVISLLGGLSHS